MKNESIFTSLLTVLFIGLKLTGYINWSWWWVLSPIWISVIVAVAGSAAVLLYKKRKERELEEILRQIKKDHPERKSKFMQRLDEVMAKQKKNEN